MVSDLQVEPNQSIKRVQFRVAKSPVMHSWGGSDRDGVYSELANRVGMTPRDFLAATNQFGRRNAFGGSCRELLVAVEQQKVQPLYDAVLIDEAQDLPEAFFRLVYHFAKDPKRIILGVRRITEPI